MSHTLHPVLVSERISIIYLDRGTLEQDGLCLVLAQKDCLTQIPVGKTAVLMVGPGVNVTHAAIKICADEGTLLLWTGEHGVRLYAAGNPRGDCGALTRQALARSQASSHLFVARKIYFWMFGEEVHPRYSIEQLRGLEGARVKRWYEDKAKEVGIDWQGRSHTLRNPIDRALAGCNAALYGITEAVILALGFSPAIGFVHSGDARSFVYDLADTVKFRSVAPLAFKLAAEYMNELTESIIRQQTRDLFFRTKLTAQLVDVLQDLLNADHH